MKLDSKTHRSRPSWLFWLVVAVLAAWLLWQGINYIYGDPNPAPWVE